MQLSLLLYTCLDRGGGFYFMLSVHSGNLGELIHVFNALMTSMLDYCNSLLYGTVDKNFVRLQRLPNTSRLC